MIDWKKQHCGVMLCTFQEVKELMPDVYPLVETAIPHLDTEPDDYLVDVKVHMLMPNQFPCIPNWHCDFVPRDSEGKLKPELIDDSQGMFLWVSNEPLTLFRDKDRNVFPLVAGQWHRMTQRDVHKGDVSKAHQWRGFIRIVPKSIVPAKALKGQLRRHSQVYLDSESFNW